MEGDYWDGLGREEDYWDELGREGGIVVQVKTGRAPELLYKYYSWSYIPLTYITKHLFKWEQYYVLESFLSIHFKIIPPHIL